jgi:hypothetical protein
MADVANPGWIGGITGLYDRVFRSYPTAVFFAERSMFDNSLFVRVSNRSDRPIIVRHDRKDLHKTFHLLGDHETSSLVAARMEQPLVLVVAAGEHLDLPLALPADFYDRAEDEHVEVLMTWEYAQPKWRKDQRKLAARSRVGNLRIMLPKTDGGGITFD